jgi:hypothetical protein
MNKSAIVKALKAAVWIVLPGALLSLLFCTLLLGSGVFKMLLPVWLGIIYMAVSFAFARISFTANRLWLRIAISAVIITVTVICLKLF